MEPSSRRREEPSCRAVRWHGYVHHVGMYLGDGYEIDAPNNTATRISTVEVVKVDQHRYADEYAGARRFL